MADTGVKLLKENIVVKLGFDEFPIKYTCDGENISPKIEISGVKDASSLALIVEDPDAPAGTFTHWIIWDIEPTDIIPEGIPSEHVTDVLSAVQGMNDSGKLGYKGPCPPSGKPHRYFFKVYALDSKLELSSGSGKKELENAIKDHKIQYGETIATYGR